MAKQEYAIGTLWIEGPLSYLEQLCLKSFLDNGHDVRLYHYGPVENVPDGVELADANTILSGERYLTHGPTGSFALHSDLFRYRMLAKTEKMIWADTDAYCVKPFVPLDGHLYGYQSERSINGGVLSFPKDSEAFRKILDFTSNEYSVPTWYKPKYLAWLLAEKEASRPVHASQQPWGVWGPAIVTHFLNETGEVRYAQPQEVLYPFTFGDRRLMVRRRLPNVGGYITENTISIHFFGRRMRSLLAARHDGTPLRTSVIGRLLAQHAIDPYKAPLPRILAQQQAESDAAQDDQSDV
jgi:hypothetical protein